MASTRRFFPGLPQSCGLVSMLTMELWVEVALEGYQQENVGGSAGGPPGTAEVTDTFPPPSFLEIGQSTFVFAFGLETMKRQKRKIESKHIIALWVTMGENLIWKKLFGRLERMAKMELKRRRARAKP